MTTIAYKNGIMAADKKAVTLGLETKLEEGKILLPKENETWTLNGQQVLAVGFSGQWHANTILRGLLAEGIVNNFNAEKLVDVSFNAIIVTDDGTAWEGTYIHSSKNPRICNWINRAGDICATGSGWVYAFAAMAVGKTAKGAVIVASHMDPGTGRGVDTWHYKPKETEPKETA